MNWDKRSSPSLKKNKLLTKKKLNQQEGKKSGIKWNENGIIEAWVNGESAGVRNKIWLGNELKWREEKKGQKKVKKNLLDWMKRVIFAPANEEGLLKRRIG